MLKKSSLLCIALSLCFMLGSCIRDWFPGHSPATQISFPPDSSIFVFGDSIEVIAHASDPNGRIVAADFFVNDRLEFTDYEEPYVYHLSHLAYRIGAHTIKVVARDEENLTAADSVTLSIEALVTPTYLIEVKNAFDHDQNAFTQGLVFEDGFLYEGTGLQGQSSIRKVELETGNVLMKRDLAAQYFGEGIAIWEDKIIQLTWTSNTGFVYDKSSFDSLASFSYSSEGWGLSNDDEYLIMSDGTAAIRFMNPDSYEIERTVIVTDQGLSVTLLNELEYIRGDVFANVYQTNTIARIASETGEVVGWIDVTSIAESQPRGVPNGIAYDESQNRLFVTGKRWTKVYEVELIPSKEVGSSSLPGRRLRGIKMFDQAR